MEKLELLGDLFLKHNIFFSMQVNTNWCWDQHPQHHVITVPTRTIVHPLLEVNYVLDFHEVPKSVCNRTQGKKSISRHPICLNDSE